LKLKLESGFVFIILCPGSLVKVSRYRLLKPWVKAGRYLWVVVMQVLISDVTRAALGKAELVEVPQLSALARFFTPATEFRVCH